MQQANARSAVFSFTISVILAGCAAPTPPLNLPGAYAPQVTVGQLVDHIACATAQAYWDNRNSKDSNTANLWAHLSDDYFVEAVDLTLMVTHTEGFSVSSSIVEPLNGAGGGLTKPFTYSGTGSTSATYNETLAIGGQLSGTQDRNIEQDYTIDLHSLVDQYNRHRNDNVEGQPWSQAFPYCRESKGFINAVNGYLERVNSPLQGDLAIPETIESGLKALDRSSQYNIYGTSGPSRIADEISPPEGGRYMALAAAVGSGGGGGSGGNAGKTSFGSKVDFYVTTGVNGGPSLSLLALKVGGGSGGSGSGGGSGGGGGGSSGGGGSGPLSFTRTTQDSMTMTFGPTCRAPDQNVTGADVKPARGGSIVEGSIVQRAVVDDHGAPALQAGETNKLKFSAFVPSYDLTNATGKIAANGALTITDETNRQVATGDVSWAGNALSKDSLDLRGTVTSPITKTVVGQIWLTKGKDDKGVIRWKIVNFPGLAVFALTENAATPSYWDSLQACDAMTAQQKQNTGSTLMDQTLLHAYLH